MLIGDYFFLIVITSGTKLFSIYFFPFYINRRNFDNNVFGSLLIF